MHADKHRFPDDFRSACLSTWENILCRDQMISPLICVHLCSSVANRKSRGASAVRLNRLVAQIRARCANCDCLQCRVIWLRPWPRQVHLWRFHVVAALGIWPQMNTDEHRSATDLELAAHRPEFPVSVHLTLTNTHPLTPSTLLQKICVHLWLLHVLLCSGIGHRAELATFPHTVGDCDSVLLTE